MNTLVRFFRGDKIRAVHVWFSTGTVFWLFLVAPHIIDASRCIPSLWDDSRAYDCFNLVAKTIWTDSILATYATATVGAIIAFYLAN